MLHRILHEYLHHHCKNGDFRKIELWVELLLKLELIAKRWTLIGYIGVDKVNLLRELHRVAVAQLKILAHELNKIVDALIVGSKLTVEHIKHEVRRYAVAYVGKTLRDNEVAQLHFILYA